MNVIRFPGLIVVLGLLTANIASGQEPLAAPAVPLLWKVDPLGQGETLPTTCAPNQDQNGSTLIGNPLLDSGSGTPGFVGGVESNIVVPHVFNKLFASVTRPGGATDTVELPSAPMGVMYMPKIELGYRFGQAAGELIVAYRFLVGDATQLFDLPGFGPGGTPVTSRLSLNVLDLDYGSVEPITVWGWDMKWRVGLRGIITFNDSQASNGTLSQAASDYYIGLGPHALVDFRHELGYGFSLVGRVEGAMMTGKLEEKYFDSVMTGMVRDAGETYDFVYTQMFTLAFQAGLRWSPAPDSRFSVTGGLTYEHFFDVGTIGVGNQAREQIQIQGGFLRAEWNY